MSPKIRQSVYLLGTVVSGLVGILLLWGGVDAGAAANLDSIVTGLGALIGGGAAGTAANAVRNQRKDGTFDAVSPVQAVIDNIPVVVGAAAEAQANLDRVRQATNDALGHVPVFGPAARQIIDNLPRF